jgi:hypothetical protein
MGLPIDATVMFVVGAVLVVGVVVVGIVPLVVIIVLAVEEN